MELMEGTGQGPVTLGRRLYGEVMAQPVMALYGLPVTIFVTMKGKRQYRFLLSL